ncbi:MAG: MCE family protein, partial [Actinobacteria bacterium]|nr:MCE family protein [Actinomycetota bacterium]
MTEATTAERRWVRPLITAIVVAVIVGGLATWYWQAHRKGVTFSGVFTSAVGVYAGSDVRILGVKVGEVDSVTPNGQYVDIGMHLDPGVNAAAGTWAVIISPNLVSDRYVQLTSPYVSGAKLRSGTQIPHQDTRTPVELDQLYQSLTDLTDALGPNGANKNGALSRLLETGASNLQGNGTDINNTIKNMADVTTTLANSKDNIAGTLDNLQKFTQMLETNDGSLRQLNTQLASVSQTLANDRQSFAAAMNELGQALGQVQQFVHDNRDALQANIGKLSTVAQTLANERDSVLKALQAAPLLIQNFINAYDPQHNVLNGRSDLNEIGVWSGSGSRASTQSTTDAPPALLPATTTAGGQ